MFVFCGFTAPSKVFAFSESCQQGRCAKGANFYGHICPQTPEFIPDQVIALC